MNQIPGRRRDWIQWGFVGPALLLLIAMNVFPLIYSIVLSFTNADLVGGEWKFVGGLNYKFIFKFAKYGQALRTTALFVLLAVRAELVLGFGLALALLERFRGKTLVLTALMEPMMLPQAVNALFW